MAPRGAGIALGPEGRDVLRALAGGEGAEDGTTARAVAALDLTAAEHGQLALAEGEAGRLSPPASSRGPGSVTGPEGSSVAADPSRPGADGAARDDGPGPSRPGPTAVARVTE